MKIIVACIVAVVLIGGGLWYINHTKTPEPMVQTESASEPVGVVEEGTYRVTAEESTVNWAGKKPLIEGYINTGSIGVTEGEIVVADGKASGTFTIDMNTLSVSNTPTKPGQENALEGHLKGERWFNVDTYPTATFVITNVSPREDSDESYTYDVTGNLTMKGETHEVLFPAEIYTDQEGNLRADASFEIDRTLWGITANSGSFFDNLAENVIDDMVALSFSLVATSEAN